MLKSKRDEQRGIIHIGASRMPQGYYETLVNETMRSLYTPIRKRDNTVKTLIYG